MTVHNHGTEDGPGLTCPERRIDGKLRGKCMDSVISDEAVEAAMRAIYSKPGVVTESDVRQALEAAAPYMLAEAWEEGANAYFDQTATIAPCWANPYRSQE